MENKIRIHSRGTKKTDKKAVVQLQKSTPDCLRILNGWVGTARVLRSFTVRLWLSFFLKNSFSTYSCPIWLYKTSPFTTGSVSWLPGSVKACPAWSKNSRFHFEI